MISERRFNCFKFSGHRQDNLGPVLAQGAFVYVIIIARVHKIKKRLVAGRSTGRRHGAGYITMSISRKIKYSLVLGNVQQQ